METDTSPAAPRRRAPRVRVRRDTELGTWDDAVLRVDAPLRGLVGDLHGYAQRAVEPAAHRTLPTPSLPLVITLGPGHVIRDEAGTVVERGSFVAGPHDRPVVVAADAFVGLQADLTPLGARRLLGRPLSELTGEIVALEDLLGRDAERLVDDLACAPTWPARLQRLEAELLARLDHVPAPRPVARAWQRLVDTRGRIRIDALADEVGWTRRHLSERFAEELGLAPKQAARLLRFQDAAALLQDPDGPDLATVAQMTGHYDQAHLAREVRAHAGLTPTQVRARVLPVDGAVHGPEHGAPAP